MTTDERPLPVTGWTCTECARLSWPGYCAPRPRSPSFHSPSKPTMHGPQRVIVAGRRLSQKAVRETVAAPTFGSLFSGYGGLEMGAQSVLGGELLWFSEYEPPSEKNPRPTQAAARIMAHHHPGVPNLGDMTKVDWHTVPRVDVLTGGSPCQDVSLAGKRAGMRAGTRSGLWASMYDAIDILRPRLVIWENVRGVLSSKADSDLEPCPGCVGGSGRGPVLRALGRVLGDLADLRYDARWYGLRAADVGAPHGRHREFVYAWPAGPASDTRRLLN